ncbi:hypothetical protein Nepgr_028429 [Nepenthes gracilis]|uniref:FAD-binding domain-containing protein n=1 Tax=Nepenthes gracilis TaxID=150966 RepID=A0AAD3TD14_NEPGR|nr:hypothetical protein Nepgr_028429 [Nepenthes gracilis]
MEVDEEIVVVGAGIAGLATALGLHRLGLKCLVLESSPSLRAAGYAFTAWTNAWKALDELGVGDPVREQHNRLERLVTISTSIGVQTGEIAFTTTKTGMKHEVRCIRRKILLETMAKELPSGTIRFSSKMVSVEDSGGLKLVHLADGSILKAKVLIGCDGVNSAVAKWLGLQKPSFSGRSIIRGFNVFKDCHGFEPQLLQFIGEGIRYGIIPCDDSSIYWFVSFSALSQDPELEVNPLKMKQFVLSNLGKVSDKARNVIETTKLDDVIYCSLLYRSPWEMLWGNINKDNVCVAGDAFHPMTPDLGQGACAALEDGVVLARCLAEAFKKGEPGERISKEEEYEKIKISLNKYSKERRWRGFDLVTTAYLVGVMQQSNNKVIAFLRDKVLGPFIVAMIMKRAVFDCGRLKTL